MVFIPVLYVVSQDLFFVNPSRFQIHIHQYMMILVMGFSAKHSETWKLLAQAIITFTITRLATTFGQNNQRGKYARCAFQRS